MKSRSSFQTRLVLAYTLLVALLIGVLLGILAIYINSTSYETQVSRIRQQVDMLAFRSKQIIGSMERVNDQIRSNQQLLSAFTNSYYSSNKNSLISGNGQKSVLLKELLMSTMAYDPIPYYRVMVVSRYGDYVYMGSLATNIASIYSISEQYAFAMNADNTSRYQILNPVPDYWHYENNIIISFTKKLTALSEITIGFVDVQISVDALQYELRSVVDDASYIICDQSGALIFADGANADDIPGMLPFMTDESGSFRFDGAAGAETVFYSKVSPYGWICLERVPVGWLYNTVRKLLLVLLTAGATLLAASIFTIRLMTRHLMRPLREICGQVDRLSSTNLNLSLNAGMDEWGLLQESFRQLSARIQREQNMAIEANERSLRARFDALQAQINPHFLFNTLSMMGSLAFESGNDAIYTLCMRLADMFRYVTGPGSGSNTFRDELDYCESYLIIIQERFEDSLSYAIERDAALSELPCPKLLLQPLVENSVKHGLHGKLPPWRIEICCRTEGANSVIRVTDDGTGFTQEQIAEYGQLYERLRQSLRKRARGGFTPMTGDAHGMVNCMCRLLLAYGEDAGFSVSNLPGEGACVEITIPEEALRNV